MLLEITSTEPPATDLGFLLHKHPGRHQTTELPFGIAHVYYPEATESRCTAALLLDVDPIALVRGQGRTLDQYVNDRPYVASSFLSTALARVYGTAMSGRSKGRPELAERAIPLEARMPAVPCRGGAGLVERLFAPLGYRVEATGHPLDPEFPDWGESPYHSVTLSATTRLRDLLTHLYVLVPVLDSSKHYWVDQAEVDKLLARGEGWLAGHPERELIARRYLKYRRPLTRAALERLSAEEGVGDDDEQAAAEETVERPLRLDDQRRQAVVDALLASGARTVLDLGCGEGKLLKDLLPHGQIEQMVGVDVSHRALERAHRRLHLEDAPPALARRVKLLHGSLVYRDPRLADFDAAAVVEVIEHLDPPRLAAFERALFGDARPRTVVLTTPNAEYNVLFPSLPAGRFRHRDHRFEWTRGQLADWAEGVADRHGYRVESRTVGPVDPTHGSPTQMAVFIRAGDPASPIDPGDS